MKHYYSVVANSPGDVVLPEHLIALGEGTNVFTLATEDLPGVLKQLELEGVQVQQVNPLDGSEAFHQLEGHPPPMSLGEGST